MRTHCLGVAALVLGLTHIARGQTCLGTASYASGIVRVDGGIQFSAGQDAYGGGLAVGAPSGLFASGDISRASFDAVDGNATGLTTQAGYALNLVAGGALQVCPTVGFAYQSGPDYRNVLGSFSSSSHAFVFGASLGSAFTTSSAFTLAPFTAVTREARHISQSSPGADLSASQNYYNVAFGVGLVIDRTITLQPAISLPAGLSGPRPIYSFAFSVNFGPKK